jgi:hypothetical protein
MGKPVVPKDLLGFYFFVKAFLAELKKKLVKLDFDQAFFNDRLTPEFLRFEAALLKCEDSLTRTREDLIERDNAREVLEADIRLAIGQVRSNHHATKEDKQDLHVYIQPHTSKTKPAPGDSPLGKHILATDGYVKVRALNAKTGKIGPPEGADGWVFAYVIADTPPAHESGYTERIYVSGSLLSVKMEEHIGKKLQCRLYWVNAVGDQSPWSANMEILIS